MEENTPEALLDLQLDYDGGNILRETVKWSRFLSVVGMAGIGLLILVMAIAGASLIAVYSNLLPGINIQDFAVIVIVCFIVIMAIVGALAYMLYRFSVLVRKGIEAQDQALFNKGLKGLKVYFLINGIFALIGLLFNLFTLRNLV